MERHSLAYSLITWLRIDHFIISYFYVFLPVFQKGYVSSFNHVSLWSIFPDEMDGVVWNRLLPRQYLQYIYIHFQISYYSYF